MNTVTNQVMITIGSVNFHAARFVICSLEKNSVAVAQPAGVATAMDVLGKPMPALDRLTATGALATYISDHTVAKFQPMNVNFGIIEPLGYKIKGKREKNTKISERALEQIEKLKGEL